MHISQKANWLSGSRALKVSTFITLKLYCLESAVFKKLTLSPSSPVKDKLFHGVTREINNRQLAHNGC